MKASLYYKCNNCKFGEEVIEEYPSSEAMSHKEHLYCTNGVIGIMELIRVTLLRNNVYDTTLNTQPPGC